MGPDAMILVFWMLSFMPAGSSSCTTPSGMGLKIISTPQCLILYLIVERLIQCLRGNKKKQRTVVFLPRYMGWHRCRISRKKPVCCICYSLNSFTILTWLKSAWLHDTQASRKDAQRRGESGKGREHTGASSFAEESFSHPASWEKNEPFVKRKKKKKMLAILEGRFWVCCLLFFSEVQKYNSPEYEKHLGILQHAVQKGGVLPLPRQQVWASLVYKVTNLL